MTTTEMIIERLKTMSEPSKKEVLDFVEYLEAHPGTAGARLEEIAWSDFSLASALRGMEDDEVPYGLDDVRERLDD